MAEFKAPFSRCELERALISTADHSTLHCSIMPDMCAGGHLTGVLQGPFEAWKAVVSVATSALWLLCGFIFRRGATCAYRKNLRYQDIAYGGAYGHRAVTSAAQFSRARCGYLSAPLMGPVGPRLVVTYTQR